MKYLANTIIDYVIRQADDSNSNLMFIMPSFPSSLLVRLGEDLQEKYNRMNRRVAFKYGVAYRLGESWVKNGTDIDRSNLTIMKEKGWYNDGDNLTSLRNTVKAPDEDCLVVMLAGYEHIDDQASLRDFFHLDQQKIWDICLNQSFVQWVTDALDNKVNPEDSQTDFYNISQLFEALIYSGLADILAISNYIEDIDFEGIMSSTDAYLLILNELEYFKLPRMTGLIGRHAKKPPFQYINNALEFFNYSMFLEAANRKKYIEKISKFETENNDNIDIDAMGSATLDDLKDYISNRSQVAAAKLRTADFIYILEQVLNYKVKVKVDDEDQNGKPLKPKKLAGVAPEIFLRAIWLTLNELKKKEKASFALEANYLKSISIKSIEFKHDFKPGTEEEEEVEDHDKAKEFLKTVLGGIDQFIADNIILKFEDNMQNRDSIACISTLEPSESADSVMSYPKANTAEPYLKFEVTLQHEDDKHFRKEYTWSLPPVHPSRLLFSLMKWTRGEFINSGNALPVFSAPYMAEIFKARDEEEVTRMLNTALNSDKCTLLDILTDPDYDTNDPLKWPVNELSVKYQAFIKDVMENGFFYAINNSYDELRKQYTETCELILSESRNSVFGPLIMKSFMFLPNQETLQNGWAWHNYLQAAVVTPLHPSVLDMLKHQHAFLCESLCYYAVQLFSVAGTKVSGEKKWDRVADLARIQWPIFGTLKNVSKTLDTTVRSFGYTHLVGEILDKASFVSARLLLDSENEDDEDISDTELFRETRTSTLIKQQLENYHTLYSFADDGLSVGAYCGREVQPVIAGVDAFISELLKDRGDRTFSLQLTLFSDSRDDSSVTSWINAWKDRWQVAELSSGKQYYKKCRISVAYRVVSKIDGTEQFQNILKSINMDLMFLVDFIGSEVSNFTSLGQICDQTVYRKFPVLEKATCMLTGGGRGLQRERVISNQRFKMGALHSEIMVRIQTGNAISDPKQQHAVIRSYDYNPWVKLVDTAHQQSTWVICIDPAIDEQLLQKKIDQVGYKREVIGFGTGVGAHGENNYTVSTEKFFVTDIKQKMSRQIADLLGSWPQDVCEQIAESLISEAFKIAGLSIVKATGPVRYVRELVANSIVRKLLIKDDKAFCDEIVSLDAYLHWFDNDEDGRRPDLLRIRAEIIDGCFHIDAQIIECKLAQESEGFLQKARQQIESGLNQLITCFKPRSSSDPEGIKDRPDQRYWWMQLHRLIASKGESTHANFQEILTALERLSEGCFKIKWQASAVAFWSDSNSEYMECTPEWIFSYEDEEMAISVAQAGKEFIRKVALENVSTDLFCSESSIILEYLQCGGSDGKELNLESSANGTGYMETNNGITVEQKAEDAIKSEEDIGMIEATVKKDIPNRILLGSFTVGEKDIYWEYGHSDLPNRHLLIFGASGAGKTYAVQALLWELGKAGQNSLIVDYTNGFTTNQLEPIIVNQLKPKQHLIKQQPLAINPFRRQFDLIDDMQISESPASTAQRVSGVFAGVYQLGDQQKAALYRAVREGVIKEENRFNLNKLIAGLEYVQEEGGPNAGSAASAISKIQPFVDMNPFGEEEPESWEKIYSDPEARCHIIQLAGFVKDASRLITEFALFDLYWYYRAKGSKEKPKIIVLDEIQNLDHQLGSPLGQFLTEGRKFGISLILATQTLSNLSKEEQDRLFQASHKLFFKPADTEIKFFAQLLATATGKRSEEWVQNLSSLKRGECYSLGHALNPANGNLEVNRTFRIKIKSLDDRL
jgi:DNA phosphorothioation-dependent restriction protein DptH